MTLTEKKPVPSEAILTGKRTHQIRDVVLLWLTWVVMICAYQFWVTRRIDLTKPDAVLPWTAADMNPDFLAGKLYLTEPVLNEHAAWDSEYYLSIAMQGYDDPEIRGVSTGPGGYSSRFICRLGTIRECTSLNYAFFPLYPMLMRVVAVLLSWLPITAVARFTLAGLIISLLGTLAAMLSLMSMVEKQDGLRSAFYLIIFPGSLFLAQVYTEGLFIGLTFGALACLRERKWLPTALLAALAVWTRPGGALLLPMAIVWLLDRSWTKGWDRAVITALAVLAPLISYLIWSLTPLAGKFHLVEGLFFGRGFLDVQGSIQVWAAALRSLGQANLQRVFYYGIEFSAVALAVITCLVLLRERVEIALYGLAVIAFAVLSGSAQGMIRYLIVIPALYIQLARWGRKPVFDRLWTLTGCLLLGLLALLFSFNYWVG